MFNKLQQKVAVSILLMAFFIILALIAFKNFHVDFKSHDFLTTIPPLPFSTLSPDMLNTVTTHTDNTDRSFSNFSELPAATAYVLQIGDFHDEVYVNHLLTVLRTKGLKAYSQPMRVLKDSVIRVFVGPEFSKEKLQTMQEEIESNMGLKGTVIAFNPLDTIADAS